MTPLETRALLALDAAIAYGLSDLERQAARGLRAELVAVRDALRNKRDEEGGSHLTAAAVLDAERYAQAAGEVIAPRRSCNRRDEWRTPPGAPRLRGKSGDLLPVEELPPGIDWRVWRPPYAGEMMVSTRGGTFYRAAPLESRVTDRFETQGERWLSLSDAGSVPESAVIAWRPAAEPPGEPVETEAAS